MSILPRWTKTTLESALNTYRVVSIVGCRQSGKTTLVKHGCPKPNQFKSLDSASTLQSAREDPAFFVRRAPKTTLVIDEIQKAPSLIGEIKLKVDDNTEKGQYVITGSADYRKLPHANESLAGRIGFVRVRNFTEAELLSRPAGLLVRLFAEDIPYSCSKEDCNKRRILSLAEKGGFYEAQTLSADSRFDWYKSYIHQQTLLDMRNLWGNKRKDLIAESLLFLAAYSSKPLVNRAIAQKMNTSWVTVGNYLSALEAMYLVDIVPAWTMCDYDRPGQAPKIFMTDTGLMCTLLGIHNAQDRIEDPDFSQNEGGKLVETWAYNQLISEVELHTRWTLHHFRSKRHEIDFLITDENNNLLAIDIKSSESVNAEDFRHIRWFQELRGKENCIGIVFYSGSEVRSFGGRCYAIPFASLWTDS